MQFFNRQITARAKVDQVVQHLMTAPGVGVIVAMAYSAVIDDPGRREHSASVGAHVGLIPRRYQSGATDISGNISKCGDELLRGYLFEAATVLLQRYVKPTMLKAWGQSLAKRIGMRRAKVAVARKLAVILHLIQTDNTTFQPGDTVAA